jgi:uncharacterized protein (TIGR03086 family)
MSRYRRRADAFERKVAAVAPGQWSRQSPCADWTARDVVRHVVDMHGVMLIPLARRLSSAPSVAEDPLAAFLAARADIENVLDDAALCATQTSAPIGRLTVEQHIDLVASADLVVHGWDLARATGQDPTIDPAEVEYSWQAVRNADDSVLRSHGAYAAAIELPADAPLQDRLLAFLGRNPR